MWWIFQILIANGAVFYIENIYRSGKFTSFWLALPTIFIPILITQFCLFYGFKGAPNLITAGALFSLIAVCLRVVNTLVLGEQLTLGMELAVLFLFAATLAGAYL